MSVAADIDRMLDAVEANGIRCPVCGNRNDRQTDENGNYARVDIVFAEYMYQPCVLPVTGGVVTGDYDHEYCAPPKEFAHRPLLCCNNLTGHPDSKSYWWELPEPHIVDYDPGLYNQLNPEAT